MKKIINFCPTGTQPTAENSYAPLKAEDIVRETTELYLRKLITVVHIHARDENGNNTYKAKHYEPIIDGIRKNCPDLSICVSLSGRYFSKIEERTEVLKLHPDMGSLSMSSLNFKSGASVNSPDTIQKLIEAMNKTGTVPEIECFDSGMVNYAIYLIRNGILKPPHYFNVIFGNLFNAQCDLLSVGAIREQFHRFLPMATVCFGGIGNQQLNSNILGLLEVDGIRIGLEDNLHIFGIRNWAKNIDLVERATNIMNELGMEVMPPADFRMRGFVNKVSV